MMSRVVLSAVLLLTAGPVAARAEPVLCDFRGDRQVMRAEGWVTAIQGRDEDAHEIRVRIWGPERVRVECANVDEDPDDEVVITSRGIGSGAYYTLQIVDFRDDGISSWSHFSFGAPRVGQGSVLLGVQPRGAPAGHADPQYEKFRLTDSGLQSAE